MKARFLALAALVLGLASCQQEFNDVAQLGGEVDYQLKVDAAELATRAGVGGVDDQNNHYDSAFGAIDYLQAGNGVDDYRVDWAEVDLRYSLEVYDWNEEGNYTGAVPVKDRMVKIVDAYEPVVFDLRLVPGRDYRFVVFADFVLQGATDNAKIEVQRNLGLRHIIGENLGDIKIIETNENDEAVDQINDEIGDAYFATKKVEVEHKALNVDGIELKRPYGKLRVIATDLAELNLNVEPDWVKVCYTAARPVGFNAVTGEVNTEAEVKSYTSYYNNDVKKTSLANHFYNADYDSDKYSTVNADGVKRHTHMTLFTDYILAEDEQNTVQFKMIVYDEFDEKIKETDFNTAIPVQRNHLTTIVGNVLTSATEITVTIDDNFDNNPTDAPYYQVAVENGFEFVNAYYSGLKMFALNDITVRAKDVADYNATRSGAAINPSIDLNGYTLTFVTDSEEPLLEVPEGSSFTITDSEGDGKVEVEGTGAAIENKGTLNIEGGNFGENTIQNNGTANVSGGDFAGGAIVNNGTANVSGGDFADDAIVNNGSVSVEGDNSGEEDRIIDNGTDAVVTNIVYNVEQLQDALDKGKVDEIIFGADLVGEEVIISQREGVNVYINGAGKKFDGTIKIYGNSRYTGDETLKIANINFETETAKDFIWSDKGDDNVMRYAHNVTIEGCTFNGVEGQAIVGMRLRQAYNVTVKNCQAENVHSLIQNSSAHGLEINDVRVNGLTGINILSSGNVEIANSTIIASEENGFAVRADGKNPGSMKISDCTFLAHRPVIVRNLTSTYNLAFEGTNNLNNYKTYQVILTNGNDSDALAAPTGTYSLTGAEGFVVFPYTWEVKSKDEFDQALASPATSKITFGDNITGNLTIAQQPDVKLTIDGANKSLNGYITVDGKSATITSAGLTIKNLNFNADTIGADACVRLGDGTNATRYTCNVTVDNCTFDVDGAVGVKSYTGGDKNLIINGCTATYNAHSLVQAAGIDKITVTRCNVSSKNGMNFNQSDNVAIERCTVDVKGYAVRFGASSGTSNTAETYSITGSSLKSACEEEGDAVIVLRATADNATLTIEDTTIEGTPKFINSAANANVYVDGATMVSNVEGLQAALKDANVSSILLGSNITVTNDWDNRNTGAKMTRAITINGDGNTLKFTGKVDDKNYMSAFRFEADATIKNLTFDMSEVAGTGGQLRAISSKEGKLIVDNCTFIGSSNYTNTRGIIFGEGVQAATNNTIASVTNSTFTNWKRGLTDNENAKDAKDVTVTGNTFTNAHCYVSAHDSIVLTGNTMNNSCVNIKTYTNATDATVNATDNTLDATLADYNNISGFAVANVTCQEGFNVY